MLLQGEKCKSTILWAIFTPKIFSRLCDSLKTRADKTFNLFRFCFTEPNTQRFFVNMMARKPTSDGIEILDRMIGDDVELRELYEQEKINLHIAQLIYDARTESGLSQKKLAQMLNTTESVISQLEDTDYEGDSLSILIRVAKALNREVKIELVPVVDF